MSHRTAPGFVATYRLQLRNGVDLDDARALIPRLAALGISHLYLSPLFTAATGSSHGYDVTDPNSVDPVLGGEEAFQALSITARNAGLGLILDIVPNHMAFTPDNPHVADLMRHGRESRFAQLFDIDWSKGKLHFPVLDRSPAELLEAGEFDLQGDALRIYDRHYALRDTPLARHLAGAREALPSGDLERLLAEQHWRVGHWRESADAISHRRFFNIASLIGVRQEDPDVFDFTHRWIIEQVRAGRVQGLRVDHIDGLAQPGAYLQQLRDAVGFIPIWIEKIVKAGETIPAHWPIEGMSGYEFMTPVTQLLTRPDGLQVLRDAAEGAVPRDTAAEVRKVRHALLVGMFAPELDRVTQAAMDALGGALAQQSAIRAAILQLALHWPVYRAYAADGLPLGAVFAQALEAARQDPMPSEALGLVFNTLSAPDDPLARSFAARFEQLTGALTAKSEEDTVFYRSVAYLPFCEVGSEPDLQAIDVEDFTRIMAGRARQTPCALNTLSTHDTKRSADARAALIALTYLPALGERLYAGARAEARARSIAERWGLYTLQTALILYCEKDVDTRIPAHIEKAMREAKDASSYEAPDIDAETAVTRLALDLVADLRGDTLWSPDERARFERMSETLVLAQAALHLTAPGIPDLYEGTMVASPALTDPDNRRPVDWQRIDRAALSDAPDLDARKMGITQDLIARRRRHPELFAMGDYALEVTDEGWIVRRHWQGEHVAIEIPRPPIDPDSIVRSDLEMER